MHHLTGSAVVTVCTALLSAPAMSDSPVPYALGGDSEMSQGCYPPCKCALALGSLAGSFLLKEADTNPLFVTYDVSAVALVSGLGGDIVGSGTYMIGGEVAIVQRMELDLKVGAAEVQHFDSGWVAPAALFPAIDVTVSRNGMFCFDTVLHIVAKPGSAPGDLDGDGAVGGQDLGLLLAAWGPCPPQKACAADVDADGTVDAADLGLLLAAWDA